MYYSKYFNSLTYVTITPAGIEPSICGLKGHHIIHSTTERKWQFKDDLPTYLREVI